MAMTLVALAVIWYGDRGDGAAVVLGVSSVILLYLEACPKCGRLVWREGDGFWTWSVGFPAKAFWIGLECREPQPPEKPE